ncbi:N-acetylmuramoyl-L-alanine amidase [Paenibacillus sp. PR3]|uniref:N-acetylmuramoyl-L-alanine amidase n=1 Tax=Paenibacillus terricola TaxID=2763503 RepID=A0ABR8MVC1_9BACL|nr:N-acetylmuramoyl-L-alanine amidase family protein [Paenibacillus terricola]MBD3918855.1 N-acetylmuramoyl-L-alanine amidase [Paenibacillus terricola]
MRKLVVVIMLLSLFFSLFPAIGQAASVTPKLYLNGKLLESKEDPQIVDKSTLVPVRVVAEGLGYNVGWSQSIKQISIQDDSTQITLTVDSRSASVNGTVVQLDAAAMIINKVTMVPIRFVAESLGLQVYYDKPTKAVHLYKHADSTLDSVVTGSTTGAVGKGTGSSSGSGGSIGSDPSSDGSGSSNAEYSSESSKNNSTSPNTTKFPTNAAGLLKAVQFDGSSSVLIDYEGTIAGIKSFTLTSPDRIVLDLPSSAFASSLTPGEVVVDSHPTLTKIRYAVGPDSSTTLRIVFDLKAASSYTVSEQSGRIQVDVFDPSVVLPETLPLDTSTVSGDKLYKVVIDAGHGGTDPGTSSASGLYEKTFNLSIVLKMKELLDKEKRIQVTYTRTDDTYPTRKERVNMANNIKADAFVSIHANSFTSPATNGTETYYNRSDSKPFAQIMHKHLVEATGLKDNGVRFGDFQVIRETTMPAILLENGYMSNENDVKALFDNAVQNRIAAAIVAGIKEQLKLQ